MRIRSIEIRQWRHFQNIRLDIEDDTRLVCIVGANGTGKSHLLELIAACAHQLGLSQGIEIPRGDPFSDEHDFSLQIFLARGVSNAVDTDMSSLPHYSLWDRTLSINSRRDSNGTVLNITAGGVPPQNSANFASEVINKLRTSKSVHFLSLDADRSYPKKQVNVNEAAQAYEIDWESIEWTRGRSYRPSSTLYDEWLKYFLAQENQSGTRLVQAFRRSAKLAQDPPAFVDHFAGYVDSLQKVLPHVQFSGVDSKKRTLLFDTTGLELTFNQLSGGEREIAFLVGQIDRFGLRHGLFLLDEPELHLNSDLIRTWVNYLTGSVESGQVWLATHSLEAVEAAGQQATFVLERDEMSRRVDSVARLDSRPILSALSRAVGTPAFSITQLSFVFIEGEEGIGERERFHRLAGTKQKVRFMECGSCSEVIRRLKSTRLLGQEAGGIIRVGGVVDRDFMSDNEAKNLSKESEAFVLPVHEVENLFLYPSTISALLAQNGISEYSPVEIIQNAADKRAGSWIFQFALSRPNAKKLPEISMMAKQIAKNMMWDRFEAEPDVAIQEISKLTRFDAKNEKMFQEILSIAVKRYAKCRAEEAFWKVCEGKQILNDVSRFCGFSDSSAMVRAAFAFWDGSNSNLSSEIQELRDYIHSL